MPTYFQGSLASYIGGAGLTNPFSLSPKPGTAAPNAGDNCCCPSSTKFLSELTNKLVDMTQSLKQQFADLQAMCDAGVKGKGELFATIEIAGTLKPKYEYLIYLNRYGPPINGIFDPIYLDLIRAEVAVGL
jgi:hypothetical protein